MFKKRIIPIFAALIFLSLIGINTTRRAEPAFTVIRGSVAVPEALVEASDKININSADIEMLCELPGIGEVLAGRIIDYRSQNGRFEVVEELLKVSGIGEKRFAQIQELVCVN